MNIGFDNELYIKKQSEHIKERMKKFGNKLYLEFGGKLFDDYHAARVLPGFDVNGKIRLLKEFKDNAEVIFCINANDIEKSKIRADIGVTYDQDLFRLVDSMRESGLYVNSVVITQYNGQHSADIFRNKLERRGVRTYIHYPIAGYPGNVDLIVSEQGYGKNEYIETTKPLVIVTAPGPCSGKLATCLSQLYHEYKKGNVAGYAKFETFPIWNLSLKHPVNLAYEAATADLQDVNMIDPFHLEAYGQLAVNYNRDVEVFPLLKTILHKISGEDVYLSPTDMGVNMVGYCIIDDEIVREASKQEIIRRYYRTWCDYKLGRIDEQAVEKIELIMKQLDLKKEDRHAVVPSLAKAEEKGTPVIAIEMPDGKIITGKTSKLMTAAASSVINSIKYLANLADELLLLSPIVLEPILKLKKEILGYKNGILNLEEVLIALSICAPTNPMAHEALSNVGKLKGCEAHSSALVTNSDELAFKKLGINLTCEPTFPSKDLFYV